MQGNDGSARSVHLPALLVAPFCQCLRWSDRNIFLLVSLSFLLGIIFAYSHSFVFADFLTEPLLIGAVLVLAGSAVFLYLKRKTSPLLSLLLILPLFFLLGNLALLHQAKQSQTPQSQNSGHIATLLRESHQVTNQVTLVSVLDTMVEESVFQRDGQEVIVSRFEIQAQDVLLHNNLHNNRTSWQPVYGRVRLSMQGRADALQPGMTLMTPAKVGPIVNFKTPGVFDYQGFLAAKDIFISGWVIGERVTVLKELENSGIRKITRSLYFLSEKVRQRVNRFLRNNLPDPISGTYQALLVGSRAGVPEEIQEHFKATGTMHLLAISGLHMGLLALMVGAIISRLLKRSEQLLLRTHVPTLTLLATLPILFGYSFVAGMNTPVVRALIMTFILFAALILRRQHSLFHLLAAAALIVLACNPLVLFTASFQFSFSAVAALILFLPAILNRLLSSSGLASEQKERRVGLAWLFRLWQGFILPAFLVSLTATLGTLPFMLVHFHRFSLIGPVMNLLVEPFLCFWALPWGLAAIPCLFIAPQVAVIFLKIGGLGIQAGHFCTALGAALPWASVWTITPTTAEILCYGLLIMLWFFSLNREDLRRIMRGVVLVGMVSLVLHFTWGLFFPGRSGQSKVAYLDVGQGTSSFLKMADGSRVLIDGGGNRQSRRNMGEQVIAPYLWQQRVWRLDQVVITHPHSDHFNGMDFILAHFRPKKLFINGDSRIEGNYQEIIDQAVRQGTEVVLPESGDKIAELADMNLEISGGAVQVGEQGRLSVNDASLVLRYRHGSRAFLFPADIGKKKEAILLEQGHDLSADVLLAPHHGSSTSSSPAFIDAVDPALIIVSAGKYGKKYYPTPANLAAWTEQGIPVVVTRDQGTISCATDGEELRCFNFKGRAVYATAKGFAVDTAK
ncbi:MAG: DNA internalization-related competence protein ComEC/Rec2 [Candidatus Electrothrix communis]|nr:MAG: DNA internalization-related competence protein ComEC/Rec2 [Candidatus Electrothrix communis]